MWPHRRFVFKREIVSVNVHSMTVLVCVIINAMCCYKPADIAAFNLTRSLCFRWVCGEVEE